MKNKTGLLTRASTSLNPSRIITSYKETNLYSGLCLARQHLQLRGQYRILIDFPIKRTYASYFLANTIYRYYHYSFFRIWCFYHIEKLYLLQGIVFLRRKRTLRYAEKHAEDPYLATRYHGSFLPGCYMI